MTPSGQMNKPEILLNVRDLGVEFEVEGKAIAAL